MDTATSELVVPSHHSAHQSPQAIAEEAHPQTPPRMKATALLFIALSADASPLVRQKLAGAGITGAARLAP